MDITKLAMKQCLKLHPNFCLQRCFILKTVWVSLKAIKIMVPHIMSVLRTPYQHNNHNCPNHHTFPTESTADILNI